MANQYDDGYANDQANKYVRMGARIHVQIVAHYKEAIDDR